MGGNKSRIGANKCRMGGNKGRIGGNKSRIAGGCAGLKKVVPAPLGRALTLSALEADYSSSSVSSGLSTTSVSVVSSIPVIEAALASAERVTLTGSRT